MVSPSTTRTSSTGKRDWGRVVLETEPEGDGAVLDTEADDEGPTAVGAVEDGDAEVVGFPSSGRLDSGESNSPPHPASITASATRVPRSSTTQRPATARARALTAQTR